MPRRHKPIKHTPFRNISNDSHKRRYPNQLSAQKAAEDQMLLYPKLELKVYQGTDKGWYLTRKTIQQN